MKLDYLGRFYKWAKKTFAFPTEMRDPDTDMRVYSLIGTIEKSWVPLDGVEGIADGLKPKPIN